MIDKPELPGSGSPTTPALIERLTSLSKTWTAPYTVPCVELQQLLRAAADALRSLPGEILTRELLGAHVERLMAEKSAAEAEVARLTQARDTLLTALQYVESVYRLNCVAVGEPSSVLAELQRVIKLTAGAEAGPLPSPQEPKA